MGEVCVSCEYCGRAGEYPDDIELRSTNKGNAWACIDTEACDAREAENAQDSDVVSVRAVPVDEGGF